MPIELSKSDAAKRAFVVGGVGNRTLPDDTREIERTIDTALLAIAADAGIDIDTLRLLVSVAEGGDRLVIKSATRLGVRYECVLPCSPSCFAEDFANSESVQEFEQLLAGAEAVAVPEREPLDKLDGYLWASRTILSRADLLLAVWTGSPGNGPAGTAHTVDLATARALPVLWIPTNPPFDPVRLDLVSCESG